MNSVTPPSATNAKKPGKRSQQKRALILEAAMRHFADHGYEATRVADIAEGLGVAKGSIFQHFLSKDGLFLEAYKAAIHSLPGYLSAPEEVKGKGFFALVEHRLANAEHWKKHHSVAYRIVLLGNYGSDLKLKKQINEFLRKEDPLGAQALIRLGVEQGEIRKDIDEDLAASVFDWTFERFQDALLMEEFDPGLFHNADSKSSHDGRAKIHDFVKVLRGALGSKAAAGH